MTSHLERVAAVGHEEVVVCHDAAVGLRAIVAIHSTALGPSLGGTRFRPYPGEAEALEDVLRLSRAMTYKSAAAGLALGGGKAVIIGDPAAVKTRALLESYARFVDGLAGRYLTAEDVGTSQSDMDVIRGITPYVTGASPALGGSGDPSPATAYGLFHALRAVAAWLWGSPALEGKTVAVSGLGKVGAAFVGHLVDAGCAVRVADVDGAAVERVRAATNGAVEVADPATVHASECDVFAPCALGGVLDAQTIAALRAHAVVGAANNQLATPGAAAQLAAAGVLYAPDYVVNAGGVINLADEVAGYDAERARARIEGIFDTVTAVLDRAGAEGITPAAAADRMAEERLAAAPRR